MVSVTMATSEWIQFFKEAGIPPGPAVNYAVMFVDNRIQKSMLLDLNKEIMNELGVTVVGDIIAILKHAKVVHRQAGSSVRVNQMVTWPTTWPFQSRLLTYRPQTSGFPLLSVLKRAFHTGCRTGWLWPLAAPARLGRRACEMDMCKAATESVPCSPSPLPVEIRRGPSSDCWILASILEPCPTGLPFPPCSRLSNDRQQPESRLPTRHSPQAARHQHLQDLHHSVQQDGNKERQSRCSPGPPGGGEPDCSRQAAPGHCGDGGEIHHQHAQRHHPPDPQDPGAAAGSQSAQPRPGPLATSRCWLTAHFPPRSPQDVRV
ncbi:uncharacterized protein C19orf47 homolog isoform X5 [Loxodonta africana]|uniref:uncharacterized protein C19orf47 homolog isoform X5 n=1 Tax=Loxodonta africana TaxID=9785 RepID=UPI0030CB5D65